MSEASILSGYVIWVQHKGSTIDLVSVLATRELGNLRSIFAMPFRSSGNGGRPCESVEDEGVVEGGRGMAAKYCWARSSKVSFWKFPQMTMVKAAGFLKHLRYQWLATCDE
jgi:hypothetical protein